MANFMQFSLIVGFLVVAMAANSFSAEKGADLPWMDYYVDGRNAMIAEEGQTKGVCSEMTAMLCKNNGDENSCFRTSDHAIINFPSKDGKLHLPFEGVGVMSDGRENPKNYRVIPCRWELKIRKPVIKKGRRTDHG